MFSTDVVIGNFSQKYESKYLRFFIDFKIVEKDRHHLPYSDCYLELILAFETKSSVLFNQLIT